MICGYVWIRVCNDQHKMLEIDTLPNSRTKPAPRPTGELRCTEIGKNTYLNMSRATGPVTLSLVETAARTRPVLATDSWRALGNRIGTRRTAALEVSKLSRCEAEQRWVERRRVRNRRGRVAL